MNKIEASCIECKQVFSVKGIHTHYMKAHEGAIRWSPAAKYECVFCKKEFASTIAKAHGMSCKLNPERVSHGNQFTRAKELGTEPPRMSNSAKEKIKKLNRERVYTDEMRLRKSQIMIEVVKNNPDSYSKNNVCGRIKRYEYNGNILKGTWELRVAQWLDSQNVPWEYETKRVDYNYQDRERVYFPDFYLPGIDKFLEVKGYKTEKDLVKWQSSPIDIVVIEKDAIDELDSLNLAEIISKYRFHK